jgi:rsbT co-antagonist protein RsbR
MAETPPIVNAGSPGATRVDAADADAVPRVEPLAVEATGRIALREDTVDQISNVLFTLSEIAGGDYGARIDIEGWRQTPIEGLARRVNELAEALAMAAHEAERARKDLEDKLEVVATQRAAIDELSCPLIEVWDGVLCVPVVGGMDRARSARMADDLLNTVVTRKARHVIIDVTGIAVMDTETVDHFQRIVKAVRLLGASCVMSGVHPSVAHTMIHMGTDLGDVTAHRSLRSALHAWVTRGRRAR